MNRPDSAIILAAGNGKRIQDILPDTPKGFISLAGLPIVERSVQQLSAAGIRTIVVVIGYAAEYYEALAQRYPQITLIKNEDYTATDSMASLYLAKDHVRDDFLLLESDLVYEGRSLTHLIDFPKPNAILTSGFTHADDEVFVSVDAGRIVELSKKPSNPSSVSGELVGISKVSVGMYRAMLEYVAADTVRARNLKYESCINGIASEVEIVPCLIEDLIWAEIDTSDHLERVKQKILPGLSAEWQVQ